MKSQLSTSFRQVARLPLTLLQIILAACGARSDLLDDLDPDGASAADRIYPWEPGASTARTRGQPARAGPLAPGRIRAASRRGARRHARGRRRPRRLLRAHGEPHPAGRSRARVRDPARAARWLAEHAPLAWLRGERLTQLWPVESGWLAIGTRYMFDRTPHAVIAHIDEGGDATLIACDRGRNTQLGRPVYWQGAFYAVSFVNQRWRILEIRLPE